MPTSDEVMAVARACAARLDLDPTRRQFPGFSDAEEQCAAEYEDLLGLLHEDELYQPADLDRQEQLVAAIRTALPEHARHLLEELVDNQSAQVWLQQEGAFHLGLAVGLRAAVKGV